MIYPEHIYDPIRKQIAEELLQKELSKLFPNIDPNLLLDSIQDWSLNPDKYHLEDATRDFWNIFAAHMEAIKLKPSFTGFVTAANYSWERRTINPRDIRLSSPLDQILKIPGLTWQHGMTVGEVIDTAAAASVIDEQQKLNDTHSTDNQDRYPIIVRASDDGLQVMDGNRRALRAALYDKPDIDAWIGTCDNPQPKDFWVPVNDLFQLAKLYRVARNEQEKLAARNALEILFRASVVARINYETRIAGTDWADDFLALKPTI